MTITYDDVRKARETQSKVIRKTTLEFSETFSKICGANVYLKNEYEQKTGSFKIRGAYYKIKSLTDEEKSNGVVAASAGIGWMIWDAAKFLLSDVVIMGLIVLGLTGIALDIFMRFIGRILMPWTRYLGP